MQDYDLEGDPVAWQRQQEDEELRKWEEVETAPAPPARRSPSRTSFRAAVAFLHDVLGPSTDPRPIGRRVDHLVPAARD